VTTLNVATANATNLTVRTLANIATLNVFTSANVAIMNVVTANATNLTVQSIANIATLNALTTNIVSLNVSGNVTSFMGNTSVVLDSSTLGYVSARRVPAGSLGVSSYVTGAAPLTTTTNLIQNYISNAAQITSNTGTGSITQALSLPGTSNSGILWTNGGHSISFSNLALSNLFIEAWVNPVVGANQVILARTLGAAYDFAFYLTSTGVLTANIFNTSGAVAATASNSTTLSTGTWYHVSSSYQRTGTTAGTLRVFVNGGVGGTTGTVATTAPRVNTLATNVYVGYDFNGNSFSGNIADVRVFSGALIVPTATYTTNTAPFSLTAPNYATNMSLVGTANTFLALQTEYFPGASTSPYGPCLTLPGTVNSYYSQSPGTHSDWKGSGGFTLEAWVNYASFANSNALVTGASQMYTIVAGQPTSTGNNWSFGVTTNRSLAFSWLTSAATASINAFVTSNTLTTGTWNHIMVQSNASNVYMAINGRFTTLTAQGFTPTGGNTTIAPTIAPSTSNTAASELSYPITIGQFNYLTGPNVAVARARLIYGANVYSSGSFTPNPNFAPTATAPFWQLESQYPLLTFPYIQDTTVLPAQTSSIGALPTPVGGVSSNVLSPYPTTYPQLDSIQFDGTGYIDYGNAATSALTTNLWANAWTIEGWVYPTSLPCQLFERSNLASGFDFSSNVNASGQVNFYYGASTVGPTTATVPLNTWTHIAITYDRTRSNIYVSSSTIGTANISTTASGSLAYTPSYSFHIGYNSVAGNYLDGNLADVRVSNVARYTGSSYTVPSAPFSPDSSTLLLLQSLTGQPGTTLAVQSRGLNAVSLGATTATNAYPPAPMSSYLLDTTGNTSVTYGQGKYVASASGEYTGTAAYAWFPFNKSYTVAAVDQWQVQGWSSTSPYGPTSSVTTVDILGNAYAGDWLQLQLPVSVNLTQYSIVSSTYAASNQSPARWWILGSRDGTNWTLVDSRTGVTSWTNSTPQTFYTSATQSYTYYRMVINQLNGNGQYGHVSEWTLNGTEESLCITNDAKVGVGIANPQRSLEVAGDLVVGGTISGGNGMGSFRNRIINGDMTIAQRGPSSSALTTYGCVDRFVLSYSITTGVIAQAQQTLVASDAPYQLGFKNSLRYTVTTACTNYSFVQPGQIIEGYTVQDLNWGASFGSPVTLSFWLRTNLNAGSTLAVTLRDYGCINTYNTPVTTVGVGAWQYVTVTIPPPPNGTTWNAGSSGSLELYIGSYYGAGLSSSPGTWETNANKLGLASSTNWPAIYNAYIEFTGVQLEKGTVATPFEFRPYPTELALCQRYTWKLNSSGSSGNTNFGIGIAQATNAMRFYLQTPVAMRDPYNLFVTTKSGSANLRLGSLSLTNGELSAYNGSSSTAITSIGNADWGYSNPTIIGFVLTASGTPFTVYQPWSILTAAYTSDFILSCEL
jgi:hypothetical protein